MDDLRALQDAADRLGTVEDMKIRMAEASAATLLERIAAIPEADQVALIVGVLRAEPAAALRAVEKAKIAGPRGLVGHTITARQAINGNAVGVVAVPPKDWANGPALQVADEAGFDGRLRNDHWILVDKQTTEQPCPST